VGSRPNVTPAWHFC